MLDLIEIELARIRKLAEQAGDSVLLYFIDLAILEAKRKALSRIEDLELPVTQSVEHDTLQDDD